MTLPSLRRLSIADLDEPTLRRLVDHGEDLLVERKQAPPPAPRFGAEVASFANTLGGWILIGVADDKTLVGWTPPQGTDLQSHLGNLLRNELDPVPPFLAEPATLDGTDLAVVRVFEADDTPVIVRGTGAVYVRDSGGKQPVDDTAHSSNSHAAANERAPRRRPDFGACRSSPKRSCRPTRRSGSSPTSSPTRRTFASSCGPPH